MSLLPSRHRWTLALASLAVLLSFGASPSTGAAQERAETALGRRIQALVSEAGLGDEVGIVVADLGGETVHYALRADAPRNPASNTKLITAAAALASLGPNFTMRTGLYGEVVDGRVANLVLRGFGDPSLERADLLELCLELLRDGVRAVDNIIVDGSYFDDEILPPAFDQQPNEMSSFRAAIGAVAIDRSSYVLQVDPGAAMGDPAPVLLAAPGYFEVDTSVTTADGNPNVIVIQRPLDDGRLRLRVRGSVPLGSRSVRYRRRVENPLVHAGHFLAASLRSVGIRGRRSVSVGRGPDRLPLLAAHDSAPLAQLLYPVGKQSDNFSAEMILKVMGAERRRPGSSAEGTEAMQEILVAAGVSRGDATLVNGSGLFDGNQVAPAHFVALLKHMYGRADLRSEYIAQLAIGGADGTLRRRLRDLPAPRIVRAKTGTLNDVISLSGYVLGPSPERGIAFSFLANGVAGQHGAARQLADQIVRAAAAHLYPSDS